MLLIDNVLWCFPADHFHFNGYQLRPTSCRQTSLNDGQCIVKVTMVTVWVYWCFTSHMQPTIFQSCMWRHRCEGGLKKLHLRSGSQRHRHFVGFFNVPVQAPTRGHPFYTVLPTHRPIYSPFTTRLGYGERILDLNPRRPHGGQSNTKTLQNVR